MAERAAERAGGGVVNVSRFVLLHSLCTPPALPPPTPMCAVSFGWSCALAKRASICVRCQAPAPAAAPSVLLCSEQSRAAQRVFGSSLAASVPTPAHRHTHALRHLPPSHTDSQSEKFS